MAITAESLHHWSGVNFTTEQVTAAVALTTAVAKSYTRGKGFDTDGNPADDLEAVIATATLRLLVNPQNVQRQTMAAFTVEYGTNHIAWTLTELSVLNRYRERAK